MMPTFIFLLKNMILYVMYMLILVYDICWMFFLFFCHIQDCTNSVKPPPLSHGFLCIYITCVSWALKISRKVANKMMQWFHNPTVLTFEMNNWFWWLPNICLHKSCYLFVSSVYAKGKKRITPPYNTFFVC